MRKKMYFIGICFSLMLGGFCLTQQEEKLNDLAFENIEALSEGVGTRHVMWCFNYGNVYCSGREVETRFYFN